MKIGVLTTDTLHHRYFLFELKKNLPLGMEIGLILIETRAYPWKKNAFNFFLKNYKNLLKVFFLNPYINSSLVMFIQNKVELRRFFRNKKNALDIFENLHYVHTVNSEESQDLIRRNDIDLGLVYGTGKIKKETYSLPKFGMINSHGGLLPGYRGLDTNLWAVYYEKPDDMAISIHRVSEELDAGEILMVERLQLPKDASIFNLRYYTTLQCTKMYLSLLEKFIKSNSLNESTNSGGDYFGPMPTLLKIITNYKLRNYLKRNGNNAIL